MVSCDKNVNVSAVSKGFYKSARSSQSNWNFRTGWKSSSNSSNAFIPHVLFCVYIVNNLLWQIISKLVCFAIILNRQLGKHCCLFMISTCYMHRKFVITWISLEQFNYMLVNLNKSHLNRFILDIYIAVVNPPALVQNKCGSR